MASSQFIQRAYIAFFNRPADKGGFDHWLGYTGDDKDLLELFSGSEEYLSDFNGKSNREVIEIVYKNLFNRLPDANGWSYWENSMNQGWVSIGNVAHEILGGAQSTDLAIVNNKTAAAQAFTDALDTTLKIDAYTFAGGGGVGHVAKEWLATVSHDNLAAAKGKLNSVVGTLVDAYDPAPPPPLPEDNVRVIDGKSVDKIRWDGSFDNGKYTVLDFDTSSTTLDFTAYGATSLFSATLVNDVTNSQRWHGSVNLSAGCKYITLTRPNDFTTEYKIELWTLQGRMMDAYYGGGIKFFVGPSSSEPELPDTAQLIGYVDLGLDLGLSSVRVNIDY